MAETVQLVGERILAVRQDLARDLRRLDEACRFGRDAQINRRDACSTGKKARDASRRVKQAKGCLGVGGTGLRPVKFGVPPNSVCLLNQRSVWFVVVRREPVGETPTGATEAVAVPISTASFRLGCARREVLIKMLPQFSDSRKSFCVTSLKSLT